MFFTMEDRDEEIAIHVDQYTDSYARDTNSAELKEVRWPICVCPFYPTNSLRTLDLAPDGRKQRQRPDS